METVRQAVGRSVVGSTDCSTQSGSRETRAVERAKLRAAARHAFDRRVCQPAVREVEHAELRAAACEVENTGVAKLRAAREVETQQTRATGAGNRQAQSTVAHARHPQAQLHVATAEVSERLVGKSARLDGLVEEARLDSRWQLCELRAGERRVLFCAQEL